MGKLDEILKDITFKPGEQTPAVKEGENEPTAKVEDKADTTTIDKVEDGNFVDDSLVLIINNIENDTDTVKTNTGNGSSDKVVKVKRKQLPGNSRMLYLSRTENGVWQENFSVNCYISGAQGEDSEGNSYSLCSRSCSGCDLHPVKRIILGRYYRKCMGRCSIRSNSGFQYAGSLRFLPG